MNRRTERVGNLIRNTIGQLLLSSISDPRIDPAKVFVSVIGTEAEQRRTMHGLSRAAGHIQELMMRQIQLRNTPILEFVLDQDLKNTLQTLQLIDQAMEEIREKDQAQLGLAGPVDRDEAQAQ